MLFLVWYFAYIIDRLSVCCSSRTWVNRSLKFQAGAGFSILRVEVLTNANNLSLVFCGLPCNFLDRYLSAKLHRIISQKTGLLIWVSLHHHLLGLYLEAQQPDYDCYYASFMEHRAYRSLLPNANIKNVWSLTYMLCTCMMWHLNK
jgi:hypothetical protein